jgi:hypothetical protein
MPHRRWVYALVALIIVHNCVYLWTKKRQQFLIRGFDRSANSSGAECHRAHLHSVPILDRLGRLSVLPLRADCGSSSFETGDQQAGFRIDLEQASARGRRILLDATKVMRMEHSHYGDADRS